jgi:hypothetical protein
MTCVITEHKAALPYKNSFHLFSMFGNNELPLDFFLPFKAQWFYYIPPALTNLNSAFCPQSVFVCFIWFSQ